MNKAAQSLGRLGGKAKARTSDPNGDPNSSASSCAACYYYYVDHDNLGHGLCRRYPPTTSIWGHIFGGPSSLWPDVHATDWCGEYRSPELE